MLLQDLTALVDGDRILQGHIAALEAADDVLELGQGLLEGEGLDGGGGVGHADVRQMSVLGRYHDGNAASLGRRARSL